MMDLLAKRQTDVIQSAGILSKQMVDALIAGEAPIVRVANFVQASTCPSIALGLQKQGYDDYLNAPTVGRIGMSFFETGHDAEVVDRYFQTALPNIEALRRACAPYPCPIDVFRCVVDEFWPKGANLQTLSGRKMFAGLSRNMRPGAPLLAHHDMFARLAPDAPEASDLLMQMAVNVYIDVPAQGGELLMWRPEISDAEFLRRRGAKYGMDIEPLGAPDIVVKPEAGDLIVFNARKLHAVAAGEGSDRLTLSCFLGYRGADLPLTFWS
ncbi:MAG: 2OG-Fe(II) oxygenase [Variovorax sp.]